MSPRLNKLQRATAAAAAFNKKYPPGTPVYFWPGFREGVTPLQSTTRGVAWALPPGQPVVKVHGRPGGISLENIEVIPRPVQQAQAVQPAQPVQIAVTADDQSAGVVIAVQTEAELVS